MLLDAQSNPIEKKMTMGHLVILVAETDEGPWTPMRPIDVPNWLKHPDIMGEMAAGNMCHDPKQGPQWYRAEKIQDQPLPELH